MAKARKILKRTKAIKNIRTITRTMEMISSARFKQTHDLVVGIRPYAKRLSEMVGDLVAHCNPDQLDHPLLRPVPGARRDVLLVLTANRGLCAAYNSSVLKIALERRGQILENEGDVRLWVSGKRGIGRLNHRGLAMDRTFTQFDNVPSSSGLTVSPILVRLRRVNSSVSTMISAPGRSRCRLAISAAGFIATSTSGESPGVTMS